MQFLLCALYVRGSCRRDCNTVSRAPSRVCSCLCGGEVRDKSIVGLLSETFLLLFHLVTSEHFPSAVFPRNVYELRDELQLKHEVGKRGLYVCIY